MRRAPGGHADRFGGRLVRLAAVAAVFAAVFVTAHADQSFARERARAVGAAPAGAWHPGDAVTLPSRSAHDPGVSLRRGGRGIGLEQILHGGALLAALLLGIGAAGRRDATLRVRHSSLWHGPVSLGRGPPVVTAP